VSFTLAGLTICQPRAETKRIQWPCKACMVTVFLRFLGPLVSFRTGNSHTVGQRWNKKPLKSCRQLLYERICKCYFVIKRRRIRRFGPHVYFLLGFREHNRIYFEQLLKVPLKFCDLLSGATKLYSPVTVENRAVAPHNFHLPVEGPPTSSEKNTGQYVSEGPGDSTVACLGSTETLIVLNKKHPQQCVGYTTFS